MDFSVFLLLNSNNEAERESANQAIAVASENPVFIFQLIQAIHSKQYQPKLVEIIQLFILHLIRNHWVTFDDTIQTFYWNQEQQNEISNQLINVLFMLEPSSRKHIIECFRFIIIRSFPLNFLFAQNLNNLYNSQITSNDDLDTILRITVFWSKACSRTIPDEILQNIEQLNYSFVQHFIQIVSNGNPQPQILIHITKALRNFIKKMSGTLVCPYFDQLLQFLIAQLTVSGVPDPNFLILKRNIIKLFITLCTLFYPPITPDESEIRINYSQHFKCDISPHLIESLIKLFSFETDRVLLSSTLYILYQYVKHKIGPTDFVTPDFLKFIIPIARLAPDDLYDIESSPLQFLAFNYSYTCNEVRTIRNSIASFIGVILTNDAILDYLYDFLLSPTVDPFDFEGRIYLMTKYVKATMTNLGPMIEPDVVQVLGCETLKVDQHPSFVITSLLMFMSSILPYLDPKEGCTLAAKCILQSDEPIILCSASKLLRKSIIECDTRIELPIVQIIPKLLMLANTIRYKYLSTSVEALIQIGGPAVYPFINDTISGLLTICNQSLIENNYKNASSMLYSIFEIINAIPDDAQILVELSENILPSCITLFKSFPNNEVHDDIFLLISVFNIKIDNITNTMMNCYVETLQIILSDEILMSSMQSICYLMCPIILSNVFVSNNEIILLTINTIKSFLQYISNEMDYDKYSYIILIISSLIQAIGQPALEFIPFIFEAITSINDPSAISLYSSCVIAITSCLLIPNIDINLIFSKIPSVVIDIIIQRSNPLTLQTYKEMKMGFLFLLKCAECGRTDAYLTAVNLLPALCERKIENNMNMVDKMKTAHQLNNDKEPAEFPPLIIPFNMPSDKIDEFQLFGNLSAKLNLFDMLSVEQKQIIQQIFH